LIALLILAWSYVFAQDLWYDSYESGLRAYQSGDWVQAEMKFKAALKAQPTQGKRIKAYGTKFIRYIPDYYLGMICIRQGRYDEALKQFEKVKSVKLLTPEDSEYKDLTTGIRLAEEQLKPAPPKEEMTRKPAQDEAKALEEQARALTDQGQFQAAKAVLKAAAEKDPASESIASLAAQIAEKEEELQAKQQADRKREDQKRLNQQFDLLLQQAGRALADKNYAQARGLVRKASELGVDDQAVQEIAARIEAAEKSQKAPSAAPPKQEQPRVNADEEEVQGLLAFYSGNYRQSIALLEHLSLRKSPSARAYFYLGCSHAALGLLQGKGGQAALQKSKEMFARSRTLNPILQHDVRYISPRILALYNQP
jgi:hypothetical protein